MSQDKDIRFRYPIFVPLAEDNFEFVICEVENEGFYLINTDEGTAQLLVKCNPSNEGFCITIK